MSIISEKDRERIRNGELASILVSPEYFREGDYTHWQDQTEETAAMPYEEYADWLVKDMEEKYDTILLYSDGTLYGGKGGISYDISYVEFSEVKIFLELAERFGVGEVGF